MKAFVLAIGSKHLYFFVKTINASAFKTRSNYHLFFLYCKCCNFSISVCRSKNKNTSLCILPITKNCHQFDCRQQSTMRPFCLVMRLRGGLVMKVIDNSLASNCGLTTSTTQWFGSYLTNRSQITSVGDAHSASTEMPIGVPQGSILGPLLFLIYVNDLPDCHLASDIILYADDTVLYYSSKSVSDLEHHINADLGTVSEWFSRNLLTLNISKCNFVIFGSPQKLNRIQGISVKVEGTSIERTQSFKYLGVTLQQSMSWADHVDAISMKINQRIGLIWRIKNLLPLQARVALYNALILPLFDYGDVIWGDKNNDTIMSELQILQNKAAKAMLGQPPRSSSTEALKSLDLKSLSTRRFFSSLHCYPQVSYWRNRFQL